MPKYRVIIKNIETYAVNIDEAEDEEAAMDLAETLVEGDKPAYIYDSEYHVYAIEQEQGTSASYLKGNYYEQIKEQLQRQEELENIF